MTIILCFLHAFLKIGIGPPNGGEAFAQVQTRVWRRITPRANGPFPASATLEGLAETALPDGMMRAIPWTCARNAISSVKL